MAITYATAVKTARMTATRDHFASGMLEIMTAANVVLAVFDLSAAAGSITDDVWTLELDETTVAADAAGVAAKAQIKNAGATAQLTGLTVGTSGADINLDNTNIAAGQNVTLSSAAIQHA